MYVVRYQSNMAQEALGTILDIQPKDSCGGGGETRETVVYKLADEMLEKVPPDYIPHEVSNNKVIIVDWLLFVWQTYCN